MLLSLFFWKDHEVTGMMSPHRFFTLTQSMSLLSSVTRSDCSDCCSVCQHPAVSLPHPVSLCQKHTFINFLGIIRHINIESSRNLYYLTWKKSSEIVPENESTLMILCGFPPFKIKDVCFAAIVSHKKWMTSQCFMLPTAPHAWTLFRLSSSFLSPCLACSRVEHPITYYSLTYFCSGRLLGVQFLSPHTHCIISECFKLLFMDGCMCKLLPCTRSHVLWNR